jgi:S1-C subfamily serine protease
MKPSRQGTGSGFVIEGKRILTNAHVVADQKLVTIRKFGTPTKFAARVEAVGHDCDLALLSVEDPLFWENMYHLPLGDIPQCM